MLLIDGVKYELWTPPSEDEFERVVKEHAKVGDKLIIKVIDQMKRYHLEIAPKGS